MTKLKKGSGPVYIPEGGGDSMKPNEKDQQDKSQEHDDLRLEDVNSFMSYMAGLLENLLNRANVLPEVDETGYSECPFAEDLYADKEEAVEKVTEELKKLPRYVNLVDQELARLRRNLAQISADASSLHLDQAKEKYLFAKRSLELHIEKNLRRREDLMDLNSRAEKLLGRARAKKFPGKEPGKRFHPSPALNAGSISSGAVGIRGRAPLSPSSTRPSLKTEVDSLISLGPIGDKNS